ncbi:MAG: hypothetical protein Q4G50_09450 [Corynebacterium sp.]|nr:hypothetical protein [Corynebacterium sp.]
MSKLLGNSGVSSPRLLKDLTAGRFVLSAGGKEFLELPDPDARL